ncbi:MAG: hypothetical protein AAF149_20060 [Bacteroidota bacterium]
MINLCLNILLKSIKSAPYVLLMVLLAGVPTIAEENITEVCEGIKVGNEVLHKALQVKKIKKLKSLQSNKNWLPLENEAMPDLINGIAHEKYFILFSSLKLFD